MADLVEPLTPGYSEISSGKRALAIRHSRLTEIQNRRQ